MVFLIISANLIYTKGTNATKYMFVVTLRIIYMINNMNLRFPYTSVIDIFAKSDALRFKSEQAAYVPLALRHPSISNLAPQILMRSV